MAKVLSSSILEGLSGKFGSNLVFRTMRGKTFISALPQQINSNRSEAQRNTRLEFKRASAWARSILLDPAKKGYYMQRAKALKLPNAYTAAVTDYMRKPKVEKTFYRNTVLYTVRKKGFTINDVTIRSGVTDESTRSITLSKHNREWLIQYRQDIELPPSLRLIITDGTGSVIDYPLHVSS
ncbi:hypothetical protein [Pseudochryseolinea flava]|uniref:Uncharacterized protein n=1 Tax=Pseudochryseolinea flava TaxID=2059302 RepID=A0A364Y126_9BACT|nr:hypothetical protein [Pseudochryseolinea flava]RAW00301.1 hypothetical protein DQQ10_14700 [Pseudochryseolinea flava]